MPGKCITLDCLCVSHEKLLDSTILLFQAIPIAGPHVGAHGLKSGAWNDLQTGARSLNCPSKWDQKAQILGPCLTKDSLGAIKKPAGAK